MFGDDGVIIIILLLQESFTVLLSCANLSLTGLSNFNTKEKTKWILVFIAIIHANGLFFWCTSCRSMDMKRVERVICSSTPSSSSHLDRVWRCFVEKELRWDNGKKRGWFRSWEFIYFRQYFKRHDLSSSVLLMTPEMRQKRKLVLMRLKIRRFQTMIKKWRSKILKRLGYTATVSVPFREGGGGGGGSCASWCPFGSKIKNVGVEGIVDRKMCAPGNHFHKGPV